MIPVHLEEELLSPAKQSTRVRVPLEVQRKAMDREKAYRNVEKGDDELKGSVAFA